MNNPSQGWLKWAIAIAASLGAILEVIDTSIVNVAITEMQANLGATISEIGWVIKRLNFLAAAFQSQGMDAATAQNQALKVLDQTVNLQAAILSFEDIFWIVGIAFIASLPLLLFLGKGPKGNKPTPAH